MQRAVAIQQQHLGPVHYDVGATLNDLAITYIGARQYEKALPIM